jgi:hypothetical protein
MILEESDIQGDFGGKVNILEGDSIGLCEKRKLPEHVSNSERLQRWSYLNP